MFSTGRNFDWIGIKVCMCLANGPWTGEFEYGIIYKTYGHYLISHKSFVGSTWFKRIVTKICRGIVYELIVYEVRDDKDQTRCPSVNLFLILI